LKYLEKFKESHCWKSKSFRSCWIFSKYGKKYCYWLRRGINWERL